MPIPKITVYITNYNYGRYLRKAIESVLNQTYQDFELFIIDDGSTDDSSSIMNEYSNHPKIDLIYQKNHGLNITNNIALRLAQGDYIVRLDADDFFEPDALRTMSLALDRNPDVGLVFPDYYIVDRSENIVEHIHRLDFGKEVQLFDQPAHGACTMIRRQYLLDIGGYDESYSCQDGYELWIKFTNKYKVNNINRPLFSYRQHGENLTVGESRILSTRRLINRDYILKNHINIPQVVAVIPLRDTRFNGESFPLLELANITLLDRKISALLCAKHIQHIVITSEDENFGEYIRTTYFKNEQISFVQRSREAARYNASLHLTLQEVLKSKPVALMFPEIVLISSIECPFISGDIIDDALHTIEIFDTDSLLSVRPDNRLIFQHHGSGMVPILGQEKFTKLEREALYKPAGGITVSRVSGMLNSGRVLHGKVGHIVVDDIAAYEIKSQLDWQVANFLATQNIKN